MKKKIEIHDEEDQLSKEVPVKEQTKSPVKEQSKTEQAKTEQVRAEQTPLHGVDPKDAKIAELIDHMQHLQAEFENYKKRVDADLVRNCQQANEDIILELITVIDSFELALKTDSHDEFYHGIELIYDQLWSVLEKAGLSRMEVEGQKFDPRLHEALLMEESQEEQGTILEELQAGYFLNGKVLVHAKVKVAKRKANNSEINHDNKADDKRGAPEEKGD
jgi:molecular chaperone GrpE